MLSKGPSDHLYWSELACKDGTPYPSQFIADGRALQLAVMFENVRSIWNKPLIVGSAYRTPNWNRKVGGAKNSQHLHGRALDLKPPRGINSRLFYEEIRKNAKAFGIFGIGLYPTFVHVDIRPTLRIVYWKGSGVEDFV